MTTTWTVGVDAETIELRDRLAQRHPLTTKHKIAKLCLRYGVRAMARAPELLLEEAACTDNGSSHACTDSELTARTDTAVQR